MTAVQIGVLAAVAALSVYIIGNYIATELLYRKRARDEAFWIRVDVMGPSQLTNCAVCRLDDGDRSGIRVAQATRIVRTCSEHRERLVAFTRDIGDGVIRLVQ